MLYCLFGNTSIFEYFSVERQSIKIFPNESEMENAIIKLILNNILLALFALIFYKLEFDNLKKLKHLES